MHIGEPTSLPAILVPTIKSIRRICVLMRARPLAGDEGFPEWQSRFHR